MTQRICSIEDCGRPHRKYGYCDAHFQRSVRGADMSAPIQQRHYAPSQALSARTRTEGECLVWTGSINDMGYGLIKVGGVVLRAHRYAWEAKNGPIPDGAVLDHICHNRRCVKVSHLRLATVAQNVWNRTGAQKNSSTGVRGVTQLPGGTYRVRVTRHGVTHQSAGYKTVAEAQTVAEDLRAEMFGLFAGGEGRDADR